MKFDGCGLCPFFESGKIARKFLLPGRVHAINDVTLKKNRHAPSNMCAKNVPTSDRLQ